MICGVGNRTGRDLLKHIGSAMDVFHAATSTLSAIRGINDRIIAEIRRPDVLRRAEKEVYFVEKNRIDCLFIHDNGYPVRMAKDDNMPLLLYLKGNCELNSRRMVGIVGTRKPTGYGLSMTESIVDGIAAMSPGAVIVSGLAYGIDIAAHRNAIRQHLSTVAVLAHGLDRIYPYPHRSTAIEMLQEGGLVTEYPSGTAPERHHFVQRNRIIAGLTDGTIVVESPEKGGSLITADIANYLGRDVFAVPGRATDICSQGCNRLISSNKAGLITSADDLLYGMNWDPIVGAGKGEPSREDELSHIDGCNPDDIRVLKLIDKQQGITIDQMVVELNMHASDISAILTKLEIIDCVRPTSCGGYRLV
ncbi:MAG: DNA-processing protein DprA [Tannerellaceae bacterium]|nr:DNA-processing protein DprA [Tannerellaceae bacterium]